MYALKAIYNNNPKLPADNCVIKPQTCGYSSFYQFSRYTYIDTTIFHHTNAYRAPLFEI